MLGGIIGDAAGGPYEYNEFLNRNEKIDIKRRLEIYNKPLISNESFFSDDTISTIAVLDAILNFVSYGDKLREYGKKYGSEKLNKENYFEYMYPERYMQWCRGEIEGNSKGSGAAMRVSPVGYLFNTSHDIRVGAMRSAIPSHNSEEAIESAKVVALIIYFLRKGKTKEEIKFIIESYYGFNLHFSLEYLQQNNIFKFNAKDIIVPAINVFFDESSNSFENCIRNAISIGGDTDTIAKIVGDFAAIRYGVPLYLRNQIIERLPKEFVYLLNEGQKRVLTIK